MSAREDAARLLALLIIALVPVACASQRDLFAADGAVIDRLYFGRSMPEGATVSEESWKSFLREIVTPRFPEGLTHWKAHGQWRGGSGEIILEDSFVLELIHPAGADADARLTEIIAEYKARFRQESVLLVRDDVRVRW